MDKLVSISKASSILGVHTNTLRHWSDSGRIPFVMTPKGTRRYRESDLSRIVNNPVDENVITNRVAIYCRVSGGEQREDLVRQRERLCAYAVDKKYNVICVYEDIASGLSDKRLRLRKLFDLVGNKGCDKVLIEHKDRLTRFQYGVYVDFFKSHNVEIEVMDSVVAVKSYEQELVEDIIAILTSFSGKLYGRRSHNRVTAKLKEVGNEQQ